MYDKELIEKVCNLTCSKEEVCRDQTTINYDVDHPFEKYFDVNIIIGALNKYISKEWDETTLAHWFCIYDYIICGGFSDDLKEDYNPLERFITEVISWDLDGLSFFDEEAYLDDGINTIYGWIEWYKNIDHIWKTRDSWHGVYAAIGEYDSENRQQYVLLINDKLKKYMIIFSDFLRNNYKHQNGYLRYTTKNKFAKLEEKLSKDYKNLSCDEDSFKEELEE